MGVTDAEIMTPFRFRELSGRLLVTNEVGDYGVFDLELPERLFNGSLLPSDRAGLSDLSILIEPRAEWKLASLMRRVRSSLDRPSGQILWRVLTPTELEGRKLRHGANRFEVLAIGPDRLAAASGDALFVFDLLTGKLLWSNRRPRRSSFFVAFYHDRLVELRGMGSRNTFDIYFEAYDSGSGEVLDLSRIHGNSKEHNESQ